MVEAKVKGSAIQATYSYILNHYGQKEWDRILSEMDKGHREVLGGKILVGRWYPFEVFVSLLRAIDDVLGKGDNTYLEELGKMSAQEGLSTVYRFFFKVGNPNFIASRSQKVWSSYYNVGDLKLEENEKGHALLRVYDWPTPRKEHCARIKGWMEGAIELSGGKNVVVDETRCRCSGDQFCEFDVTWD